MTAIIYTWLPDYRMASFSARILAQQGVKVILAIDSEAPPLACEYATTLRTKFERGGNLNGREFILGHLNLMMEQATGAYTIKIDSDTILTDASAFIAGRDETAVGLYSPTQTSMVGLCYALRTADLPRLIEAATLLDPAAFWMEDRTIGELSRGIGRVHLPVWRSEENPYWQWSQDVPVPEGKHVINFPTREGFDRSDVARAMKSFL